MNTNNLAIILDVGHTFKSKGAYNPGDNRLNEYDCNSELAMDVVKLFKRFTGAYVHVVMDKTIKERIEEINKVKKEANKQTTILLSMHFNAYNSSVSGCEVLIADNKMESAILAESLLAEFENINDNRGIKIRESGSRGWELLSKNECDYSVLCEPLFIDSFEGEYLLDPGFKLFLADSYFYGVINFMEGLT